MFSTTVTVIVLTSCTSFSASGDPCSSFGCLVWMGALAAPVAVPIQEARGCHAYNACTRDDVEGIAGSPPPEPFLS